MTNNSLPMMPRGFIFDLDGVLVDTVPAHVKAWSRTFKEFGFPFTAELYEQKIDGRPRLEALRDTMMGLDFHQLARAAEIKNDYFLNNIEDGLFKRFESSNRFVLRWREKGVRMATASSSVNVKAILEKIGLVDAFEVVIGGDDVEAGKPDPEAFLKAARGLNLAANECIVFEDAAAGVQAAKRGGFFCVGIHRYGDVARLAGADLIVNDLDQLKDVAISSFANRASGRV
jgi:beta-phosphoglucomutase family hydrolase